MKFLTHHTHCWILITSASGTRSSPVRVHQHSPLAGESRQKPRNIRSTTTYFTRWVWLRGVRAVSLVCEETVTGRCSQTSISLTMLLQRLRVRLPFSACFLPLCPPVQHTLSQKPAHLSWPFVPKFGLSSTATNKNAIII